MRHHHVDLDEARPAPDRPGVDGSVPGAAARSNVAVNRFELPPTVGALVSSGHQPEQ